MSLGMPGMHGTAYANYALHEADVIIAVGTRFDDRVTGKLDMFAPGAKYLSVFRVVGTAAMMAYAIGGLPESIWKGTKWSITMKFVFDGILYGLVTAGTFGWLWPAAAGTP